MKMHLCAAILVVMGLTVHCLPAKVKYHGNNNLRSHRSPYDDGYYGPREQDGYPQDPQFNYQPSTDGAYGPNQESDGNFQVHLQPETPLEADQTVQGSATEASIIDAPVTQNALPEAPAKEDREADSDEDDSDEDDVSDLWNVSKLGKKNPTSVNFFPVMFGSGRGRSGGFDGTVAVANSFSTGRRGVATSNANANRGETTQQ